MTMTQADVATDDGVVAREIEALRARAEKAEAELSQTRAA